MAHPKRMRRMWLLSWQGSHRESCRLTRTAGFKACLSSDTYLVPSEA